MESYVQKGIFGTKWNTYDGAFSNWVKPYKNVLNSIKLPFGSIFRTTHRLVKKLTTENVGRKSLLLTTLEQFLFSKFEITRWNDVINGF